MRTLYVLAAVCAIGISDFLIEATLDPDIVECSKQLNISLDELRKSAEKHDRAGDNHYRVFACKINKLRQINGISTTSYEDFTESIKLVNYGVTIDKDLPFTREQIENLLNECKPKEHNDYEFFKCIQFFEPPFINFYNSLVV